MAHPKNLRKCKNVCLSVDHDPFTKLNELAVVHFKRYLEKDKAKKEKIQ